MLKKYYLGRFFCMPIPVKQYQKTSVFTGESARNFYQNRIHKALLLMIHVQYSQKLQEDQFKEHLPTTSINWSSHPSTGLLCSGLQLTLKKMFYHFLMYIQWLPILVCIVCHFCLLVKKPALSKLKNDLPVTNEEVLTGTLLPPLRTHVSQQVTKDLGNSHTTGNIAVGTHVHV